jgi:hypothetical protein
MSQILEEVLAANQIYSAESLLMALNGPIRPAK